MLNPLGLRVARTAAISDERVIAQHHVADDITARHDRQDAATIAQLTARYENPVFGEIDTWELLVSLSRCIDPTDGRLGAASQLVHVEQMLTLMVADGITDEDLLLVALFHDLGKVLLLTDEDPANIVCLNHPIGEGVGGGLDELVTQWNHDEFAFSRLAGLLPDEYLTLVRFHSVLPHELAPCLAPKDIDFATRLHTPFAHYDHESKSAAWRPTVHIDDFRDLVRRRMPARLEI